MQGTTTTINTTNLAVQDNNITLNTGGTKASATNAGLTVDSSGDSSPWSSGQEPALLYDDTLTSGWKLRKGGTATSHELITAARTLVRGSFDYGGTATFNATNSSSIVVEIDASERLALEPSNARLRHTNNQVSVGDNNIGIQTGTGTGTINITAGSNTSSGNISIDSSSLTVQATSLLMRKVR